MEKNSFVHKKVKSLTLGEKLQQLREENRLTVQNLSRKINIKVLYIEALESGKYDKLPTKVYAKGFVRSYARFFGVPEKNLLDLFEREYSIFQNINVKEVDKGVNRLPKVPRFIFTPRVIIIILGLIVFAFIGAYLYLGVDNFISSPWLVIDEPFNNSVVEDSKVTVSGQTRSNSMVFINGQQTFVDMDGKFTDEIGLSQGVNTISVKSINKFEKESVEEIIINAKYEIVAETEQEQKKEVNIVVKADNEPIWLNVIADDIDIFNETIKLDEEKEFDAKKSILVTSSSGVNTLVSFDGGETFEQMSKEDGIVRDWTCDKDGVVLEEKSEINDDMKKKKSDE
jgi:cytoskeletal protein RodZ